jgi:hypothetical protein
VEPEATLVGTKGRVELDTVTAVDLDLMRLEGVIDNSMDVVLPDPCHPPRQHGTG